MSDAAKEDLQSLYFDLGNALASRSMLPQAADAYALAMYYARRAGNSTLADHCREQILVCQPDHIAAREASAPLFFAQLLMRYPAGYARNRLAQIQTEPASAMASPLGWTVSLTPEANQPPAATKPGLALADAQGTRAVMASAESVPPRRPTEINVPATAPRASMSNFGAPAPTAAPMSPPVRASVATLDLPEIHPSRQRPSEGGSLASLFAPDAPVATHGGAMESDWNPVGISGLEQHHALASDTRPPGGGRVSDDFEMPSAPWQTNRTAPPRPGMTWLNPIAALVAIAGAVAIGFFAFKLYPEVSKIDLGRARSMVDHTLRDGRALVERFQRDLRTNPPDQGSVTIEAFDDTDAVVNSSLAPAIRFESTPSAPSSVEASSATTRSANLPLVPRIDNPRNVVSPNQLKTAMNSTTSLVDPPGDLAATGLTQPELAPARTPPSFLPEPSSTTDAAPRGLPSIDAETSPLPAPDVEWSTNPSPTP